ncbi:hypothetical protein D3C81_1262190 [compost metagenome]
MMIRTGIELIARGRVRSGFFASAAVVPTSSIPTKANTAIWKPAKKPIRPCGNMPSSFHRLARLAVRPAGDSKPTRTMYRPVPTRARIATILIMANQNSISPNIFTVIRFSDSSRPTQASAGAHWGRSGNQNCE